MYGIEGLKLFAVLLAGAINTVTEVVAGKFLAAWGFVDLVTKFRTVDFAVLKKELGDLDTTERAAVEKAFKDTLSLENKALEAKLESVIDVVELAVAVGYDGYAIYQRVLSVVEKLKAVFA